MTVYKAYVEKDRTNWCFAFVPELPGCFYEGPAKGLTKELPKVVSEHVARLRGLGFTDLPRANEISVEIAQTVRVTGSLRTGDSQEVLLGCDTTPLSLKAFVLQLAALDASRTELLALVKSLPPELLDWKPGPRTRSVRENLEHIASAERYYMSRMELLPDDIFKRLEAIRTAAVERLKNVDATDWPKRTRHYGEEWTPKKALRRFVQHEWYHILEIERALEMYRKRKRKETKRR